MSITVGLDFGTHQTKICVERKEGVELDYEFLKFKDRHGNMSYTLPSIIQKDKEGMLSYGYVSPKKDSEIIRYFKQATFTNYNDEFSQEQAMMFSVWYISYIFFDLEEFYDKEFAIQAGVPSDGSHLAMQMQRAVRIILSAYRLVEEVFENDKEKFLNTPFEELTRLTEIVPYSKDMKDEYSILIFPEAYACLLPLVKSSKIPGGMSLMVDIGGGTTDISFFSIKDKKPLMYDFYSVNKGLNFLTNAAVNVSEEFSEEDKVVIENKSLSFKEKLSYLKNKLLGHFSNTPIQKESIKEDKLDSNVKSESEITKENKLIYKNEIESVRTRLISEFKKQCDLDIDRLHEALKGRPIIYTGGGSTYQSLRLPYGGFKHIMHISEENWHTEVVKDIEDIRRLKLFPILSTAYGLSVSVPNDKIVCEPLRDVFSDIRNAQDLNDTSNYGDMGFSYMDDYDAWK